MPSCPPPPLKGIHLPYCFQDTATGDFSKYWDPKIIISNSATSASTKSSKSIRLAKDGKAFIVQKFRVKGIFTENLELHEFPFDIQVRIWNYTSSHFGILVMVWNDTNFHLIYRLGFGTTRGVPI